MKKSLVFILIFSMVFTLTVQAQLKFGVRGGLNVSNVSTSGTSFSSDNLTGFQLGPTLEWLIIGNFGIEAAALYSQKGIKIQDASIDKSVGYLDIPVDLKFVLGVSEVVKPYIAAGPYISFNLSDSKISDEWRSKSFGAGLNFGAGVKLFNFLQLGASYGLSLTDNYSTISEQRIGDITAKNKTWSVTAGIYF